MIKVDLSGFDRARARLQKISQQMPFAAALAVTRLAHGVRKETVGQLQAKLDRPKPYTTRQAVQVIEATKRTMTATVGVGVKVDAASEGTPYAKAIGHLFTGGSRQWKGMEGAFRRIGMLWPGYIMVPGKACPLDQYGNVKRTLVTTLISYFGAFGEQGYTANATALSKKRRAKFGKTESGYRTIGGVVYFISRGRGQWYGKQQHLPAGIWAKTGIHGSDVKPILMFVKMGKWQRYIDLAQIAKDHIARDGQKTVAAAIRQALATAK